MSPLPLLFGYPIPLARFYPTDSRGEFLAEGVGFEPTREREPPAGFQDRCLKPLGHPSELAMR